MVATVSVAVAKVACVWVRVVCAVCSFVTAV